MKKQKEKYVGNLKPWREIVDRELQNPEFAREYLLAAMEEGLDIQVALKHVVRAVGVRRYARWVKGIDHPNLVRVLNARANPTLRTLERILQPLKLRLTIANALEA